MDRWTALLSLGRMGGLSLLAFILNELTEPPSPKLLQFALRIGAQEFTVRPIEQSTQLPIEQLQTFFLGQRKREVLTGGSKRRFESMPIWIFNEESAATMLRLSPGGFHNTRYEWVIYKGYILFAARPGVGRSYMNLMHHEWEELFRLGFRFGLYTPDGKVYKEEFTEIDLRENRQKKLMAQYAGLANVLSEAPPTVDALFKRPYGVLSFPPDYGRPRINPEAANNKYILSWWSGAHDELLTRQIKRDGWKWWPSISAIADLTDREVFTRWQIDDPQCLNKGWDAVLAAFARARALQKGLLNNVQWPRDVRNCELCGEKFSPSTHHPSLTKVSPLTNRYCSACINQSLAAPNRQATKEDCLTYVRRLSELLGRVTNSDFGTSGLDLAALDEKNASDVLRLLQSKPPLVRIKDHFGSWLALLVEAGVLEDGTRKTKRGTQCLARDGHVCLSIPEKTIDDLLTEMGIPHEREVRYPESEYRCDFFANGVYIEYFGLTGNAEYDDKTKEKLALGKRLRIRILALYPEDVIRYSDLRKTLAKHLLSGGG